MDVSSLLEAPVGHPVDGGGSCDIYQGRLHDGRIVALKIGRPHPRPQADASENSMAQQRMRRMLEIWTGCSHPNIVQLIGGAVLQTGIAAVYGWVEYGGIMEYLKRHPTSIQICEGVGYLHENSIIHNGLKGTNILVSSDGVPQIHLSFFACTNLAEDGANGNISNPNIRWAAPELLLAQSRGTFASDIYALGMEIISMAVPYADQRDKQVIIKIMNRELPSRPADALPDNYIGNALWDALCTCWSFDPADRPSARQVIGVIHAACISDRTEPNSIEFEGIRHRYLSEAPARLVITEDTRIEDLVLYFQMRHVRDYTSKLMSTNINTTTPFADTALANVYKIIRQNRRCIAVKCVKHVTLHKKLKRAARELSCWLSHKHENILPVLGFAVVKGDLAMVSQWMSNGCVTEYVFANPGCDRVALCVQLSRAIAYLHENDVVHGDIKGPNVLISELGTVKITDFGVSIMEHTEVECSTTLGSRGTQRWQSPEILLGKSDSTKQGDVYALGMTLIEIYTGEPPYGHSMHWSGQMMIQVINDQLRPSRPVRLPLDNRGNQLWELMKHCWTGNPNDRPTSAEVYERLKGL